METTMMMMRFSKGRKIKNYCMELRLMPPVETVQAGVLLSTAGLSDSVCAAAVKRLLWEPDQGSPCRSSHAGWDAL